MDEDWGGDWFADLISPTLPWGAWGQDSCLVASDEVCLFVVMSHCLHPRLPISRDMSPGSSQPSACSWQVWRGNWVHCSMEGRPAFEGKEPTTTPETSPALTATLRSQQWETGQTGSPGMTPSWSLMRRHLVMPPPGPWACAAPEEVGSQLYPAEIHWTSHSNDSAAEKALHRTRTTQALGLMFSATGFMEYKHQILSMKTEGPNGDGLKWEIHARFQRPSNKKHILIILCQSSVYQDNNTRVY